MPTNLHVNHQESGRMQMISFTVVVAFLCQLVGLVGPGWIVVSSSLLSVKIGIWFAVVCVGESGCETVAMTTYTSTDDVDSTVWLRYQLMTTAGVAACLLAVGYLMIGSRRNPVGWYRTVAFLMFFAGGLAIAPSALVGKDLLDSDSLARSFYDFPWALLLTGIGGVISALTMLITICLSCNAENSQIHPVF